MLDARVDGGVVNRPNLWRENDETRFEGQPIRAQVRTSSDGV